MKKLNKAMSVAVAAAMMVSLGACGNSTDAAKDGTQSAGASGKVYHRNLPAAGASGTGSGNTGI